jgi:hypothetical protein
MVLGKLTAVSFVDFLEDGRSSVKLVLCIFQAAIRQQPLDKIKLAVYIL